MHFPPIAALSVACILSATQLYAKTYRCTFTEESSVYTTIPSEVIIRHNESTGAVTVNDSFINNYIGSPIAATLNSLNATRALFSWTLSGIRGEKGNYFNGIQFRVNVERATGKASITSDPGPGYSSTRGSGTCTIR